MPVLRKIALAVASAWILAAAASWPAWAADVGRRTTILCVSQDSTSVTSIPGAHADGSNSEKTISSFTQWMFEAEKEPAPSEIRFLWIPYSPTNAPELKIQDAGNNHSVIRLLSQTRHGILAATSGSGRLTNIGWMFAINFKAEQVIATQVFSNLGGARGRAFTYSCRFDNQLPKDAPAQGKAPGD